MAKNIVVRNGNLQTETAMINFQISRSVFGGLKEDGSFEVPRVVFSISMMYGDCDYLLNDAGDKVRLLTQGMKVKNVSLKPEEVAAFFVKPITVEGKETVLGEYLASLMDAAIPAEESQV